MMGSVLAIAMLAQMQLPPDSVTTRARALADSAGAPGGAVVMVRNNDVWVIPFGTRDSTLAVDGQTTFRVASVSKVFTAAAAARLSINGTLDLNADVRTTHA